MSGDSATEFPFETVDPLTLENFSSKDEEPVSPKKKRARNPDLWKKEKRKRAILAGQAYVNTKGEIVGPRAIGPNCRCKYKCYSRVTEDQRNGIFKGYYSLKSYDEQNAYLYGLIRRHDILRKRKPVSDRRTCSYKYFIRIKGKELLICKKAFANIHGISDKKIRTLCIKHEKNILFPRDNRGRHQNRPKKVTPELVTLIKQHILKSLSGPNGTEFIKHDKNQGPDVNISKLHKSFLLQFEPEAIDAETEKISMIYDAKVKSWLYFKVFHEEFKSMDFNTVKRKLADLRRSLEASGAHPIKKKSSRQSKACKQQQQETRQQTNHSKLMAISVSQSSLASAIPSPASCPPSAQMGAYMGTQHLPHNLQLSMLSLPHLSSSAHHSAVALQPNSSLQQAQQQPLNLQTGLASQISGDQPQQLPLNLQSIVIPVFSNNSPQMTPAHHGFSSHHNMQQFQSSAISSIHTSVSQPPVALQPQAHLLQGSVGVAYSWAQHNPAMY